MMSKKLHDGEHAGPRAAEMVDALRDAIERIESGQITDCIFVGVPAESGPYPRVLVAEMGGGLALVGACVQAQRVASSHSGYGEPEIVRLGYGDEAVR